MDETTRKLRNYFDEMVVYKDLKNSNFSLLSVCHPSQETGFSENLLMKRGILTMNNSRSL